MEVFHLFPPLDKLAAEATARALRLEALSVSEVILEQLLRQVVPEDGRSSLAGLVDDVSQSDEETNQLQYQNESDVSVAMVTDEMRKDDKRSRLQVLLKLLELSCDMVSSEVPLRSVLNHVCEHRLGTVKTLRFCLLALCPSCFELLQQTTLSNSTSRNSKSN